MKSEEIVKLPLNEILETLGYSLDLSKTTKRAIVMKAENGDKVVINRLENGDYLYFNVNGDYKERGNLYSFCKNREIEIQQVIQNYLENNPQPIHSLTPINSIKDKARAKETIKLFLEFENVKENNHVLKSRGIDFEFVRDLKDLKQDAFGNLCIKTYNCFKIGQQIIINQTGYSARLNKAITHSKDGKKFEKPLKNLVYGEGGFEILIPNKLKNYNEIKNIIISESVIDSLSYRELNNLKELSVIIGIGGNRSESHKEKLLTFLATKMKEADFHLAFDNDQKGRVFKENALVILAPILPEEKIHVVIPKLKDFNDDLQIIKELNLSKEETEIEKKLKDFIRASENKINNSLLSDFEKNKIKQRCEKLREKIQTKEVLHITREIKQRQGR